MPFGNELITHYSNLNNVAKIAKDNLARFTWDYCADPDELLLLDQSTFVAGSGITSIDWIVEALNVTPLTGTSAAGFMSIDTSTLPKDGTEWRIDYTVNFSNGETDHKFVFFNPTIDANTKGCSDPNTEPLRDKTVAADASRPTIFEGVYDIIANTPDLLTPVAGAVNRGFQYQVVNGPGTFFGELLETGDMMTAKVDDPAGVNDWAFVQANLDSSLLPTQDQKDAMDNAIPAPDASTPFATSFDYAQTIYVRTNGNDVNDGLNPSKAVATILQAHTLAAALTPSATNRISISLASGEYEINNLLQLGQYVDINGPEATIKMVDDGTYGEFYIEGNNVIVLNKFYDDGVSNAGFYHLDGGGSSYITINEQIASFGNCLTFDPPITVQTVVVMHVKSMQGVGDLLVQVPSNGVVLLNCENIFHTLNAGSANAFECGGSGVFTLNIDNYFSTGAGIKTAFEVTGTSTMNVTCLSITSDILYNVGAGSTLNIWTNRFSGTTPAAAGNLFLDHLTKIFAGAGTIGRVPDSVTETGNS